MSKEALKRLIKSAPTSPGVYVFKNLRGKKLYIGKALNLKARLKNYLTSQNARIKDMMEKASNLRMIKTSSDTEALILESQMIKSERPPYNITMRDDKQYFYVCFTDGPFPRIIISHQPTRSAGFKSVEYLGPFTDGTALRSTLSYLRRIFPYCTCKGSHNNFCLNYHIGKCLGYCCLKNIGATREEKARYIKNVRFIKDILSGKRKLVISDLKLNMQTLADKEIFEEAIRVKHKIDQLNGVFENAKILSHSKLIDKDPDLDYGKTRESLKRLKASLSLKNIPYRIEGYDVSNIQGEHSVGAMVVLTNGKLNKDEYRKFKLRQGGTGDVQMLKETLSRRFNHPEWRYPDLVVIDGGKQQLNTAKLIVPKNIPIVSLVKNDHHKGVKICHKSLKETPLNHLPALVRNLILTIDQEAHRFAISFYRKTHIRQLGM